MRTKIESALRNIFRNGKNKTLQPETGRQGLGAWGEDVAVAYLQKIGYRIIARHWLARAAEIDIVAKDKDEYVFIEVKTRSSRAFGLPEDAVSGFKVQRLVRGVELYRLKYAITAMPYRIDVVAIEKDPQTGTHELRHLKAVV